MHNKFIVVDVVRRVTVEHVRLDLSQYPRLPPRPAWSYLPREQQELKDEEEEDEENDLDNEEEVDDDQIMKFLVIIELNFLSAGSLPFLFFFIFIEGNVILKLESRCSYGLE